MRYIQYDFQRLKIPVFLYCDDYAEYEGERGKLLWDLREESYPFALATKDKELEESIKGFNKTVYQSKLQKLFEEAGMVEDGKTTQKVVQFLSQ